MKTTISNITDDEMNVLLGQALHDIQSKTNVCVGCGDDMFSEQNACSEITFDNRVFELPEIVCSNCLSKMAKFVRNKLQE